MSNMVTSDLVKVEGQVKEIFGNKYIVEGTGGRKLVETGKDGSLSANLVVGDKVTFEGLEREGFVHAIRLRTAAGARVEFGPPPHRKHSDSPFKESVVLDAARNAGFRDPRVLDVRKHHAEVGVLDATGNSYELHIEFDGHIRKQFDNACMTDEAAIRTILDKAGLIYAGSMRPEKKHMVVTIKNGRGETVEVDIHRDGTIKHERPKR
jgi:hypothetical protein